MLDHLQAAAADQPPHVRLEHLLAAWRVVPAREIALLIDEVSRACRAGQAALDGETAARKAAWTGVVEQKNAADVDRLVESLIVRDEKTCVLRLEALGNMPRNPRITTTLIELFAGSPRPTASERLWKALEEVLLATGDPRLLEEATLARLPETIRRDAFRDHVDRPRALDDAERAAVDDITKSVRRHALAEAQAREQGDALLRAVYERLHDDGPREVYGDWLSTRGDPRGELIALQLSRSRTAGEPSKKVMARERALLAEHGRAWLGRAARLIATDGARFERGFLAAARLEQHLLGDLSDDVWRTCVELDVSELLASAEGVAALLDSDALHALDSIVGARLDVFERLVRPRNVIDDESPRLDALRKRLRVLGCRGPLGDLDALDAVVKELPSVEELVWFQSGDPARLLKHVVEGRLRQRLQCVRHSQPASSKGRDVHTFTLERSDGELSRLYVAFGGRDAVGIHVAVSFAVEVVEAIGLRVKTLSVGLAPGVNRSVLAPLERAASRFELGLLVP